MYQAQLYAVQSELVRSAERGPEDTAVTVSVSPTFFRAEITDSNRSAGDEGSATDCRPVCNDTRSHLADRADQRKKVATRDGTKGLGFTKCVVVKNSTGKLF